MNTTDTTHYLNFIDNQWVASDHGGAFAVDNPATDAVVATASAASAAQALLACDRAAAAQRAWRKLTSTRKGSGLNTRSFGPFVPCLSKCLVGVRQAQPERVCS